METPIRIIGNVVSRNIYVEYSMRLFKAIRKTQYLTAAAIILVPMLLFGMNDFLTHHQPFPSISCIGVIALAYAFFGIPVRWRSRLGKRYDQASFSSLTTDYLLTPTHLITDTSLGHSELKWAAFTGAVEYQQWLMLHLPSRSYLIIDTQKIQLPATVADVRALLTQHNIPFGIEKITKKLS